MDQVLVLLNKLETNYLKDKKNIKYFTIAICLLFATSLIGILSYFLFYIMFAFSSLKCILWLFESYEPSKQQIKKDTKYISEQSPANILEYYVVPIFIILVMYPISYLPLPFVPLIVYTISIVLCVLCMTNNLYRQRFCVFVRDVFTNRDENGKYIPGSEGGIHKLLQTICHMIECININTFNLTYNTKLMYNKLNDATSISQALQMLINDYTYVPPKINHMDIIDQLDEEIDNYVR